MESLVEEARADACALYNSHVDAGTNGPRAFSKQEIGIVENFVVGYCQLKNLTRQDICRRVWSTDRPKDKFWDLLSKILPYRSRASVYKHIRRQYHVFEIRATWTREEDDYLRKLTQDSPTDWKKIGDAMNRMPEDCRDRWRNYIKCGENRVQHKWSEEEEQMLKSIVMEMITKDGTSGRKGKPFTINWTMVSEKMNGMRSRIQCRYKWNKLLKRESLSKVSMMDTPTKIWILNRLLQSEVDADSIDWDYLVHVYEEENKVGSKILWNAADFKLAFELARGSVKDHKRLAFHTVLTRSIEALYEDHHTPHQESIVGVHPVSAESEVYEDLRPKTHVLRPEQEAASVANAAVAAVSSNVNEHEAQHQEYSLWR